MKRFQRVVLLLLLCININAFSQTETFASGTYIINMGSAVQTIGNGLKPYGLVYELLKTYKVPVRWYIRSGKNKDGIDFSYADIDYRGGTFIIPKEFITSEIADRIAWWQSAGVVGNYTSSVLTLPVGETLTSVPNWTLNNANITIAQRFFRDAGIPSSAYNTLNPSALGPCNDIFVMPHATPSWSQHGNLYNWNRNFKGAIWSGCHAVSSLENLINPLDTNQRMNFLTTGGLMDFDAHSHGTVPYSYYFNRASYHGASIAARADDPVFQMVGSEDAAHANGSEQIYIPMPGSSWRNTTHIGCYDSMQSDVTANDANGPAALTLYGRGFGLSNAGLVMYQSGHDIEGSGQANVAALRQFFNFSFEAMKDKVPVISSYSIPLNMEADYPYVVSVDASSPVGSSLTYQWSSTCTGTFINPNSATAVFTPAFLDSNVTYTITCVITDNCSRYTFKTVSMIRALPLPVTLLDFKATLKGKDALLSWMTTNEDHLAQFSVYRSFNGKDFEPAGDVKAKLPSADLKEYTFTDRNITENDWNNLYYRLRMEDTDRKFAWSPVVRIKRITESASGIQTRVYPNPAAEKLNIEIQQMSTEEFTLSIYDDFGRLLKTANYNEANTTGKLEIDLTGFEKGIYVIVISDTEGNTSSVKFVKG